jgi:hypothetical protein
VFYATLQSLFFVLHSAFPRREFMCDTHPREAVRIRTANLCKVICELTELPGDTITSLINATTFTGGARQSLWGAPFVYAGTEDCFVFLPALKSSLLRSVNDLIDAHAEEHSVKGVYFQEHLRKSIASAIDHGPLKDAAWIAPRAIDTPVGDIDLCAVVGENLILCEAKFVGNAVDAFEYFRAGDRLDEAVRQIYRKLAFVTEDLPRFVRLLTRKYGLKLNKIEQVIPIIVTSDAFHVGFPRNGIAVADLPTLMAFFKNDLPAPLSFPSSSSGSRPIYANATEAIATMAAYLQQPPDIAALVASTRRRDLDYPTGVHLEGQEIRVLVESVDFA